jgi:hypothetical protein
MVSRFMVEFVVDDHVGCGIDKLLGATHQEFLALRRHQVRTSYWPRFLERVNNEMQSNPNLLFFYLRNNLALLVGEQERRHSRLEGGEASARKRLKTVK